jgi:hypothetical protein
MLSGICRRAVKAHGRVASRLGFPGGSKAIVATAAATPRLPLRALTAVANATMRASLASARGISSGTSSASPGAQAAPAAAAAAAHGENIDVRLRNDVSKLGRLLGESIQQQDAQVFDHVERLRELGRQWRAAGTSSSSGGGAFDEMVRYVAQLPSSKLRDVARSFATFLSLANTAENHHRVRKLKDSLLHSGSDLALFPKADSCGGAIRRLVETTGGGALASKEDVLAALQRQSVEIVLTAHPTEVNRKTVINYHNKIRQLLGQAEQVCACVCVCVCACCALKRPNEIL